MKRLSSGFATIISFTAISLEREERQHRALFRQPVNNKFIEAWRTYQEHWNAIVSDIVWDDLGDRRWRFCRTRC